MSKVKKGIRMTFSAEDLREYYAYLGGRVGAIKDRAAISDERPSVYAEEVALLRYVQDRIATAIREHEAEEQPPTLKPDTLPAGGGTGYSNDGPGRL